MDGEFHQRNGNSKKEPHGISRTEKTHISNTKNVLDRLNSSLGKQKKELGSQSRVNRSYLHRKEECKVARALVGDAAPSPLPGESTSPYATGLGGSFSAGLCAARPGTRPHGHRPAGPEGTSGRGPYTCGPGRAGWPRCGRGEDVLEGRGRGAH